MYLDIAEVLLEVLRRRNGTALPAYAQLAAMGPLYLDDMEHYFICFGKFFI